MPSGLTARGVETAIAESRSIWDEYSLRFPLDMYLSDPASGSVGTAAGLARRKATYWKGVSHSECDSLFERFRWLWTDGRIKQAMAPGSFAAVCDKKIKYLKSVAAGIR